MFPGIEAVREYRRPARWPMIVCRSDRRGRRAFADARPGRVELVRWVRQYHPDIVLTGHVHRSPSRQGGSWVDRLGSTWVFNSGRQIGPSPTHVVFDTEARMALWFSLAGSEVVRLDEPLRRLVPERTELPAWFK